jgi:hypothetical protein
MLNISYSGGMKTVGWTSAGLAAAYSAYRMNQKMKK